MSERVPEKKQDLQWPVSEHDHLVEHTEGSEGDTLVMSCKGVEYARKTFPKGYPSDALEWWLRAVTAEHLGDGTDQCWVVLGGEGIG